MAEKTLVSIICTVYNKSPWLHQTLDSLLQQETDFPVELLVVDDASTDGSAKIISEFAAKYSKIVRAFYHQENQGISKTWVEICEKARGTYIARCDGDDFWIDKFKLQKQVDLLKKTGAKWSNTDFDIYDENGEFISAAGFETKTIPLADTFEKMLATRGFTMASTWLVDRKLMLEVNKQLDLTTSDDTFNLQLDLFKNTSLAYLPEATVAYRINQGSDSRPKNRYKQDERFDRLLKTQLDYLDKYPNSNYKKIAEIAIRRANDFEKILSQNDYYHSKVTEQFVTIYYTSDGNFSETKTLRYQLQYQDDFSFSVPEDTKLLRIDLSELPSFYKRIRLSSPDYQTELLPKTGNGIQVDDCTFFVENDPQLIYDISSLSQRTFRLHYEMFNVDRLADDDFIVKVLAQILDVKNKRASKADELQLAYENTHKELEEMTMRYNSVTHSRRWTISTKLINFFRRNK